MKIGSRSSIIQCPSCQTKFAVRTAQIEEVRFPRFHCSRCDHIFGLDDVITPGMVEPKEPVVREDLLGARSGGLGPWSQKKRAEAERAPFNASKPTAMEEEELDEFEGEEFEEEFEEVEGDEPLDEQIEDDYEAGAEYSTNDEQYEEAEPVQRAAKIEREEEEYRFEDDQEGRAIEEADRQKEPWRFTHPFAKSGRLGGSRGEEQISFPFDDSEPEEVPYLSNEDDTEEEAYESSSLSWMDKMLPLQDKPRSQAPRQYEDDDWLADTRSEGKNAPEEKVASAPKILRRNEVFSESFEPELKAPRKESESAGALEEAAELAPQRTERRRLVREVSSRPRGANSTAPVQTSFNDVPAEARVPRRWNTSLLLIAPVFMCLAALSVVSFFDPRLIKKFTFTELTPTMPPPGLYITDVQFTPLELENDEKLPALTGKVVNKTDQSFREVVVMGGLYDKKGARVAPEEKINLSSPLHKVRIKSLSAERLLDLVSEGGSKTFELKPGKEAPFILTLAGHSGKASGEKPPAYFNAEVFSVKK